MNLVFENFSSFLNIVEDVISTKLIEAKLTLENEGRDIENISELFIASDGAIVDILPDGTLVKVNLYIAIQTIDSSIINTLTLKNLYKYHIYRCSTISQMFDSGRKHRYKINSRDDGTFYYKLNDYNGYILKDIKNQKLNICKHCLKIFLDKSYVTDNDVENFNLQSFHQQKSSFFDFDTTQLEKGEDALPNVYSRHWESISTQLKRKRFYICENCGWRPEDNYQKRFIHTHHQNGDKRDNGYDNLKVLCIECHSNIDNYHLQIKSTDSYREFIAIQK